MSPIRARSFLALLLALATAAVARGSDQTGAAAFEPYVKPKRVTRPRDLTKEFVQKEPGFALEYGGKRVSPAVPGFLYHGERIDVYDASICADHTKLDVELVASL